VTEKTLDEISRALRIIREDIKKILEEKGYTIIPEAPSVEEWGL